MIHRVLTSVAKCGNTRASPSVCRFLPRGGNRAGAPLGRNQYMEVEVKKARAQANGSKLPATQRACEKIAEAIVMHGGKRGQIVKVCADPSCRVHHGERPSAQQLQRARAQEHKRVDETKTKDNRGLLGVREQEMADTVLIPGLKVNIDGELGAGNRVVATTITVDGDDLESSQMIQAGLHPTAEQVAANVQRLETHQQAIETNRQNIASNKQQIEANIKQTEAHEQRFAKLDDFDVKGETTVKFATGRSTISDADKQQLKQLAQQANQVPGYLIEVIGFADSTGKAAMNTKLSEDLAKAVVTYLIQQCGVPVRRIVAPGAMGEYGSTATNEISTGRAANRRVEVKVLSNKGISGGS
jgi:OOP family OmpA-OmpF porin